MFSIYIGPEKKYFPSKCGFSMDVSTTFVRSPPAFIRNHRQWLPRNKQSSRACYTSQGRPVLYLALYVEIQGALSIYGRGPIKRVVSKSKRRLAKRLNIFFFGTSEPPNE
jgi:hypothetical protein